MAELKIVEGQRDTLIDRAEPAENALAEHEEKLLDGHEHVELETLSEEANTKLLIDCSRFAALENKQIILAALRKAAASGGSGDTYEGKTAEHWFHEHEAKEGDYSRMCGLRDAEIIKADAAEKEVTHYENITAGVPLPALTKAIHGLPGRNPLHTWIEQIESVHTRLEREAQWGEDVEKLKAYLRSDHHYGKCEFSAPSGAMEVMGHQARKITEQAGQLRAQIAEAKESQLREGMDIDWWVKEAQEAHAVLVRKPGLYWARPIEGDRNGSVAHRKYGGDWQAAKYTRRDHNANQIQVHDEMKWIASGWEFGPRIEEPKD